MAQEPIRAHDNQARCPQSTAELSSLHAWHDSRARIPADTDHTPGMRIPRYTAPWFQHLIRACSPMMTESSYTNKPNIENLEKILELANTVANEAYL